MRFLPFLLLGLSACASGGDKLGDELHEFENSVPRIEARVIQDDARLSRLMSAHDLDAAQQREVSDFVSERRTALTQLKKSLNKLRDIHSRMKAIQNPTEEQTSAAEAEITAWRDGNRTVQQEFERLKLRDAEITGMIKSAPKKP